MKIIGLILCAALSMIGIDARADTKIYQAILSVPGVGSVTYNENLPTTGGPMTTIALAQQQLMTGIRASLTNALMPKLVGIPGYKAGSGQVWINGPISVAFANGNVTIWPGQVGISLTAEQSQYGITATCQAQLRTNLDMTIVGTVDPVSGNITYKQANNFGVTSAYDCSTNVDWVPVLGTIVDSLINNAIDSAIGGAVQSAYDSLASADPLHFMGLNQIPSGVFIFGGVDYGAYMKSSLTNLFNSANVSVSIGDPKHYIVGPQGYPHIATSSDLVLEVNINGVDFQLSDQRTYVDDVYCPPPSSAGTGRRYCSFF